MLKGFEISHACINSLQTAFYLVFLHHWEDKAKVVIGISLCGWYVSTFLSGLKQREWCVLLWGSLSKMAPGSCVKSDDLPQVS